MSTNVIDSSFHHCRDFVGYGEYPPQPKWPNNAQIALSFVLNYEEGAESFLLDGDQGSERLLCDLVGISSNDQGRNLSVESLYEYGSRRGFWRILKLFKERQIPLTIYGCGLALQRNPEAAKAMVREDWEVATHGYRWLDYSNPKCEKENDTERQHIQQAMKSQEELCGYKPFGFYQGKPSPFSRQLALSSGVLYDNDDYSDDLPYWSLFHKRPDSESSPLLILPYTFINNDMKFATMNGFSNGEQFFVHLKDSFDFLYKEGETMPKMMTIGLHCRLVGHPGRAAALARFVDYVLSFKKVWICRRIDIALHWYRYHYPTEEVNDTSPQWRKRLGKVGAKPKAIAHLLENSLSYPYEILPMKEIVRLKTEGEKRTN